MRSLKLLAAAAIISSLVAGPVLAQDAMAPADTATSAPATEAPMKAKTSMHKKHKKSSHKKHKKTTATSSDSMTVGK